MAETPQTNSQPLETGGAGWPRSAIWAYGCIALITAFRFLYIFKWCPYDLAPDEAHYWDWSRHLDWSYYSKGPLVAWLIRASCEVFGSVSLVGAIRVPAVICGGLFLVGIFELARLITGRNQVGWGAMLLAASFPAVNAFSIIMTIDAPYMASWVWACVFGYRAVMDNRRRDWLFTGLIVAVGILAKYTMAVWLASFAVFLWMQPTLRGRLWSVNAAMLVFAASLSALPILYWNAQHDWVTFRHVAGQAGGTEGSGLRWFGPAVFVGGQMALLLGYWFVAGVFAFWRNRPGQDVGLGAAYLWWISVPTFVLFTIVSIKAPIQLNWPAATYIGGLILVVDMHYRTWDDNTRLGKMACRGMVLLGLLGTLIIHDSRLWTRIVEPLLPLDTVEKPIRIRQVDPAARLKGWRYLGEQLDIIRRELRQVTQSEPIIAGIRWDLPGEIAVYSEDHPPVYTLGLVMGDRHSQYDWWRPNPIADAQVFQGKAFIIVGVPGIEHVLLAAFEKVEPAQVVTYRDGNRNAAQWYVWVCHQYRGVDTLHVGKVNSRH